MGTSFWDYYNSPIGLLVVESDGAAITAVHFVEEVWAAARPHPLTAEAVRQLDAYFRGELRTFELPLAPRGTPFQQRVWRAVQAVPYGATVSYGQIAAIIGAPRAARAVGGANRRNPIVLCIPCHRVIGHGGRLGGYGANPWRKVWLLRHEGWEVEERDDVPPARFRVRVRRV